MKTVCIVPIKENSKRVKGKNFKKINNIPLYQHLFKKLLKTNFDEIYVDSDSKIIEREAKKYGFKFIKRLRKLSKDNANGNDLLNYHSSIIDAKIYFQLFITSPLISIKTINNCILKIQKAKKYDSILTATKIYSWFCYRDKPINYKPSVLPRSQNASPIIRETTALYGIKSESLKKYKCRIGKKPFFYYVDQIEAIDLDEYLDFKIVESIMR